VARVSSSSLPAAGMLSALTGFITLQIIAYLRAGVFEYPLDDVYIHLAMASQMVQGTYGVNAGEPASAASSIIYPLLLTPFPNTEFQRFLPVFWNTLAVAGCGWVWGRIVEETGKAGVAVWLIAVAAPLSVNMSGVGYTGMEAAPHMLMSLLMVLGLWRALTGRGVAGWFIAAVILAPLFRYEGLALSLLVAGILFLQGERRAAAVAFTAVIGLVGGFSLFLLSLGLPALPGSVLAKMAPMATSFGLVERYAVSFAFNVVQPGGALLAALILVALMLLVIFPVLRRGPPVWILLASGLAALAHLLAGQIGWMNRYEPYAVVSLLAAILLAGSVLEKGAVRLVDGACIILLLAGSLAYLPKMWSKYLWNPRAIHLQQAQLARIAQDYIRVPVAVNDLGRIAWRNPDYVLDLFGLGSDEARRIRFGGGPVPEGWADPLAARHGVKAAMIYDVWFGDAAGSDWVRIGELTMDRPRGALGDWVVAIYATDPAFAPELRSQLESFAPTLPEDATLTLVGAGT